MAGMVSAEVSRKKKEWEKTVAIEEEIRKLEAEGKRLSSRKLRLYEDYRSGKFSKEQYRREYESTASRILEIEKRILLSGHLCRHHARHRAGTGQYSILQPFSVHMDRPAFRNAGSCRLPAPVGISPAGQRKPPPTVRAEKVIKKKKKSCGPLQPLATC